MTEEVIVRKAKLADVGEITAMWAQYMRAHALNPAYRRLRRDALDQRRKAFAKRIRGRNSVIFVLEGEDGGLDGMLVCFIEANEPHFLPEKYARLQVPFVRAEARRRGNLKRLLRAAFDWAAERGLEEVRLYTGADNVIANAVADELGFEAIEVARRRPLQTVEPDVNWEDQL